MSEETATLEKEVITEEVETTEVIEKPISDEKEKANDEEETDEVITDNQDDDDEINWKQPPPTEGKTESPSAEPKSEESNKDALIKQLEQENAKIKSELQTYQQDPLLKAYGSYLNDAENPSVKEFLSQVGAVVTNPYEGLQGESLMRKHYERLATEEGLSGEDLEDAVEEELSMYLGASKLQKSSLEKSAKEYLKGGAKGGSIEELEAQWKQSNENKKAVFKQWGERQTTMAHDLINAYVNRGKYNGREVDSKWGERMKYLLSKSYDATNPEFVRTMEGSEDLDIQNLIEYLDFAGNRDAYKKSTKKQVDAAKSENIEEKAIVAHNAQVNAEKASLKAGEQDISWFLFHEKQYGKRHPQDPRGKKA